jgi:phosphatidylglycerol:prolipoprotein diacylglycerol transferase
VLPVLFESTFFTLYAYPLFMGLAWGVGFYLSRYIFEKHDLDTKPLIPMFFGVFLTSWIGAKVFFLLFSSEHRAAEYLYANEFWLGGGFVFYGGLIFALVFYFIYSLWLKKFPFHYSKFLAPGLIFGHAIGRIGCFFTGCCYGSQCDLPWAVKMHGEFIHPVQLYETVGLFIIGYLSLKWISKNKNNIYVIINYLMFYSLLRFCVEFFRGDLIRGVYLSTLSTSQLISIALFIIALIVKFISKKNRI